MVDVLARLGLSVNYRCVMQAYLEKKMGLFVIQQFTDEGVVSPPRLRRGLFTVGDTDNIDHNPSSTTSAESFSMALLYRCFQHVLPWTKMFQDVVY